MVSDDIVDRTLRLMREHMADQTSEDGLAAMAGVSRGTLRSRFADAVGLTPSAVWRNIRLATAQDILIQTDAKVEGIALMCGYGSARAFIRMFKSATGQSPALWRQAARVPVL
jgi:transcriptional regulator GlxA family with amidase domain